MNGPPTGQGYQTGGIMVGITPAPQRRESVSRGISETLWRMGNMAAVQSCAMARLPHCNKAARRPSTSNPPMAPAGKVNRRLSATKSRRAETFPTVHSRSNSAADWLTAA